MDWGVCSGGGAKTTNHQLGLTVLVAMIQYFADSADANYSRPNLTVLKTTKTT